MKRQSMKEIVTDDLNNVRIRTLTTSSTIVPANIQFVNINKWTLNLMYAILVVTLSTSFVMGVNIGGPNVYNSFIIPWTRGYPFPCQKDDATARWVARVWWGCNYHDPTHLNRTGYYYLPEVSSNKQILQKFIDSFHTICFTLGGAGGGLTGQYWYFFLSRRNTIFGSMIFQLFASIFMIIPLYIYHGYTVTDPNAIEIANALENKHVAIVFLYISRFLSGWSAGMCCVVTTIYLMDISPRTMRGKIIAFHQLFIVIGVLTGQIVGIPWFLGRHNTWNWGMSWIGLFPLIGCGLIWTIPESPRYLIQEKERNAAAQSLRILRQTHLIEGELDEIEREEATAAVENLSLYHILISERFRWPLLTSIGLNVVQQLSGINTVFFYSSQTFSSIGLIEDKTYWGIVSTGMINFFATLVSMKIIDTYGRRLLILVSLFIISALMILLCIFIELHIPIVSLILTLMFIAVFATSLGPIPYIYPNEVFSIEMRPKALSISMFASWICNTLITATFSVLRSTLDGVVFLIFCGCCFSTFILLWFKMPETNRKKLSEIESFWQ